MLKKKQQITLISRNDLCNSCGSLLNIQQQKTQKTQKIKSVKSVKSDVIYNKAALHPRGQRAAPTFQILLNYECCKDTIKKRDYKIASPFLLFFFLLQDLLH